MSFFLSSGKVCPNSFWLYKTNVYNVHVDTPTVLAFRLTISCTVGLCPENTQLSGSFFFCTISFLVGFLHPHLHNVDFWLLRSIFEGNIHPVLYTCRQTLRHVFRFSVLQLPVSLWVYWSCGLHDSECAVTHKGGLDNTVGKKTAYKWRLHGLFSSISLAHSRFFFHSIKFCRCCYLCYLSALWREGGGVRVQVSTLGPASSLQVHCATPPSDFKDLQLVCSLECALFIIF